MHFPSFIILFAALPLALCVPVDAENTQLIRRAPAAEIDASCPASGGFCSACPNGFTACLSVNPTTENCKCKGCGGVRCVHKVPEEEKQTD
ncbi:hypothetical protein MMC10_007942 [Thelotrema lepadinum]|nr:hypothetical protein [Thelotrema lepadinum]